MSRRGWVIGAVIVVVAAIVAFVLLRDDDDGGDTVTAAAWTESVCGAMGAWQGEVDAVTQELGGSPSAEDAQAGLQRAIRASKVLVENVDAAGVPDTPNGVAVEEQVTAWAGTARDDLMDAEQTLNEAAGTAEEAAQQAAAGVEAMAKAQASGRATLAQIIQTEPQIGTAYEQSSTCQSLGEVQPAA